jgi:hypothetical protein
MSEETLDPRDHGIVKQANRPPSLPETIMACVVMFAVVILPLYLLTMGIAGLPISKLAPHSCQPSPACSDEVRRHADIAPSYRVVYHKENRP